MRLLRALAGSLLWILSGVLGLVGVLLCATKDDQVVEYALARTTSPTLVAEYQTMLPSKSVLREKLHELYAQLASERVDTD